MNQKTTRALIEEKITKQDAEEMKASIKAEIARIVEQLTALDCRTLYAGRPEGVGQGSGTRFGESVAER